MNKIHLLFFTVLLSLGSVQGQNALSKKNKVDALNSVLHFVNEGCHGMVISYSILENYNIQINKYVDSDSIKIYIDNSLLLVNIFEDPEYYEQHTPFEWFDIAVGNVKKAKLPNEKVLVAQMTKMKALLAQINQIRFDVEAKVSGKNLKDTSVLNAVYAELINGEELYESYYRRYRDIIGQVAGAYKSVMPNAQEVKHPMVYSAIASLYKSSRDILLAVRDREDEGFDVLLKRHVEALNAFEQMDFSSFNSSVLSSKKVQRTKKNLIRQSRDFQKAARAFYETAEVPDKYKAYGKFYYYYDKALITKFNRFGSGIAFELNALINSMDIPALIFSELPHEFKCILPKKLITVDHIAATDSKITNLPSRLKDREIQMSTRTIKVDSLKFEVALYDHMIEDGDIISLNFNGDWIVEKMPLKAKKKTLKLMLNSEGKNYFILHAENVGRRPPNTMAVDYYYRGRKQQIILKSDLNVSEMIEIEYVN